MRRKLKLPFFIFFILIELLVTLFIGNFSLEHTDQSSSKLEETIVKIDRKEFIKEIAPAAEEVQEAYGIRASLIIAQASLESNFGQSELASKYKNLFGVKADSSGKHIKLETKEYLDGEWITATGDFAWYDSWRDSIIAHARLMREGVDWDKSKYAAVVAAGDYKEAAQAIQDAGYATDPTYASKLIELIEQYKLYQYDN
ncbi:glycoside hydrolase family 73 protein [Streptococcaceae bacterium ESL0729]|nr:glycoside hydrolase family 73 protein [Streptococcaceae bacterium ESL0729]